MRATFIAIALSIPLLAGQAAADVPTSITVQGKLTDAGGAPLPPGPQNLGFRIFDAQVGGTQKWPLPAPNYEAQTVTTVSSGLWTAMVGAINPLDTRVFDDTVRWLEIIHDPAGVATTLPRVRLVTSPFAFRIGTVDGASGGTITSKVSIGQGHTNSGLDAFVAGAGNTVVANEATIGGGSNNQIFGANSVIGGGEGNYIGGDASFGTISGGSQGYVSKHYGTLGGGYSNDVFDTFATISGGYQNQTGVGGVYATVGGGKSNSAQAPYGTVAGGQGNSVSGINSAVGGGQSNNAVGSSSTVAGGYFNGASGQYAAVPGGYANGASGNYSFAAGRGAIAGGEGTFVWSDATGGLTSNNPNSFNINADNGFVMSASNSSYGAYFNNGGIGDGIRTYSNTSQGTNWAALYAVNTGTGTGVYASTSIGGYAGYFSGPVNVTGTIVKGGGGFKIDHPLDPENKYLYHSFVESPDMKNLYDGVVTTDSKGNASVTLPDWFSALNRDFRYQLTVIGEFAQAIIGTEIEGNHFSIKTDKPNVKVSWQVTGTRQDAFANANRIPVEQAKNGKEIGRYIHPTLFGKSAEQALDYEASKQ